MPKLDTCLTPRQLWLYQFIKYASECGETLSVEEIVERQNKAKELGNLPYDDLYTFADKDIYKNCPAIYEDKDAINENDAIDQIVCCKNRKFYIGSEEETIEYHNKLYRKICTYSHKAKLVRSKISQDGQCKLFDVNDIIAAETSGENYHDAFARHENLLKQIDNLKEENENLETLVQQHKNAANMWKERYDLLKLTKGTN